MAEDKGKATKSVEAERQSATPAPNKRPDTARMETHSASARSEEGGQASLEQIREILFGPMYRELERGLLRVDAHLVTRARELEEETRRRTEVLETHVKNETAAIASRLEREFGEIGETLRKISREHRDAIAGLEQKLAKLEESAAKSNRELRHQFLEQAKSFLDELQRLRKELFATLQQELSLADREFVEDLRETREPPRH